MENKIKINKIEVKTGKQLNDLYKNGAFTLEGFDTSQENIIKLIEWFEQYGGVKNPFVARVEFIKFIKIIKNISFEVSILYISFNMLILLCRQNIV